MIFHRGLLGLVTGLTMLLVAVAAMHPPEGIAALSPDGDGRAGVDAPARDAGPRYKGATRALPHPARGAVASDSAEALARTFHRVSFDLNHVATGARPVPRLFVARLPGDMPDMPEVAERKAVFFKSVLPLVLKVNEDIRAERRRLWSLHSRVRLGESLDAVDRLWLIVMAERYKVARGDIDALLTRVDVVPISLALAQAAEESGWGTSRFTREGNALFGQWTWDGDGIEPLRRDDGRTHKIRAFDTLLDSVQAYALNLNSHNAYGALRKARAAMRAAGRAPNGYALAGYLTRYSERGEAYVEGLRSLMETNELGRFDEAKLAAL